jgi:hypothetical protein
MGARVMATADERIECQLRDMQAIAEYVETAKREVKFASKAWEALDLAEARLQGLGMYTALGRTR